MKSHNILIEPWRETSSLNHERGERLFRWTVTYRSNEAGTTEDQREGDQREGDQRTGDHRTVVRYGQGTAHTHAEARQAAEDFLIERGVELHWQQPASSTTRILTPRSGKPRFLQL